LPDGCSDLEEAVRQLDKNVTDEDLQVLDQRVQEVIRRQFRALVHVCMTSGNVLRTLAPLMRQEAEAFLAERVAGATVVDLYLAREAWDGEEKARDDLGDAFDRTKPALTSKESSSDICLFAVPTGPGEEHVRDLAAQAVQEVALEPVGSSPDEMVFLRERHYRFPLDLAPFTGPARDAYRQVMHQDSHTPHSRLDIREW
jgi:hypothetical protein